MKNRFIIPIGSDNEGYFSILEKYKTFIGGVYLAWPGAPSGRVGFTTHNSFFNRIYKWCLKNKKIFNILFNMEAHDFQRGFDYKTTDLQAYHSKYTTLIFASTFLFKQKIFEKFKKGISVNYRIDTIQQVYSLKSEFPEMKSFTIFRDINRDHKLVSKIIDYANSIGLNVDVMLNEGCIPFCPVKKDHNTFVTLAHFSDQRKNILEMKESCINFFTKDYSNILRTPSITKEMLSYYNARFFKVVGRDTPIEMLEKFLRYYIYGEPIDIGIVFPVKKIITGITTDMLPSSFHKKILNCKNECYKCNYCTIVYKEMLKKSSQPGKQQITEQLRDFGISGVEGE